MLGESCTVIPMSGADSDLIFQWRNLPKIVELSGSGKTVSLPEHETWFRGAIQDPHRIMLKVVEGNRPVGQLRFDVSDGDAENAIVSIYLLPEHSGRGLGRKAFAQGLEVMKSRLPAVRSVTAEVVAGNSAAVRFFLSLGFTVTDEVKNSTGRALILMQMTLAAPADHPEGH